MILNVNWVFINRTPLTDISLQKLNRTANLYSSRHFKTIRKPVNRPNKAVQTMANHESGK